MWDNVSVVGHKRSRPILLRESAPTYVATVGDRGRVVLPSPLRRRMSLKTGDTIVVTDLGDGSFRMMSRSELIQRLRGSWRTSDGRSLVDDLIAERRREAASEDEL